MQSWRNPGSSPQAPLPICGYFLSHFFVEWGPRPTPHGLSVLQSLTPKLCRQSRGNQVIPTFPPLQNFITPSSGCNLKAFKGVRSGFARRPLHPAASLMEVAPAGLPGLHTCSGSWKASASGSPDPRIPAGCHNHTLFPRRPAALGKCQMWESGSLRFE